MLLPIKNEVFVDLVREDEKIVLLGNRRDRLKFRAREDLARGIRRRIDNQRPRPGSNRSPQPIEIKRPVAFLQGNRNRLDPQRQQRIKVIAIERLEQDDLVARIEQRQRRGIESACRARRHQHLRVGIHREMIVPLKLPCYCLPQRSHTIQPGIDVVPFMDRLDGPLHHRGWHLRVADPLRQVHAPHPVALNSHRPNLRLDDMRRYLAQMQFFNRGSH